LLLNKQGEGIMQIIEEETGHSVNRKITDQLCGRLVQWDVGTPREELIIPEADYCRIVSDLSTSKEVKPDLPLADVPKTTSNSVSAINKVLKLHNLRYGSFEEPKKLCGRLIVWDVGTYQEKFVKLEANYQHTKYEISPQFELKPYAYVSRAAHRSPSSSLKPIAERFYSRNGYFSKDIAKKPSLN
jgi:hypothetical protein